MAPHPKTQVTEEREEESISLLVQARCYLPASSKTRAQALLIRESFFIMRDQISGQGCTEAVAHPSPDTLQVSAGRGPEQPAQPDSLPFWFVLWGWAIIVFFLVDCLEVALNAYLMQLQISHRLQESCVLYRPQNTVLEAREEFRERDNTSYI